ncbi:hypothetical protein [Nocardia sp. NPDC050793]|uniref:phage integrase central domain-containing protein n=1 Tax=Nocardia sp. NPDC050793 TaxID=3155159 RepID=UPI0033C69862
MTTPKKQTFKTPGKKRKRQYGEGAIYRRKDGMYVGTVSLPAGPDGKRRRTPPVYSLDRGVVADELEKVKENLRNGIMPVPKMKIRVEDRIKRWAEKKKRGWSPNHYKNVLATINSQITPSIGGADFKALNTGHIDYLLSWMDDQTKQMKITHPDGTVTIEDVPKWSSRTKQIAYDRVRDWLDDELKERPRYIRENVAALVERPAAVSKERGTHTPEQARAVLETALEWGDPLVTLWATRYLTAKRQGELLGLTEDRVDIENMTLDISWQLQQLPLKPGMKNSDDPNRFEAPETYEIKPLYKNLALVKPKTRKSHIISMPVELAIMLLIYLENRIPNEWGLLWVTDQFRPIRREYENEAWADAQARAEVPIIQGHGTRHTANTLIPVDEAHRMKFLGQSTAAANRLYLHEDLQKLREGQNALAGMLLPEKLVPASQRR